MMKTTEQSANRHAQSSAERTLAAVLCLLMLFPAGYLSPTCRAATSAVAVRHVSETPVIPDTEEIGQPPLPSDSTVYLDAEIEIPDSRLPSDTIPPTEVRADDYAYDENGKIPFNPSPTRAVWLSALCPGLGQIYNRRYWKLPLIVGGFMGLGYGASWNNGMLRDYTRAYNDLMDNDPSTKSYMDFFPPTTNESDLDKAWLQRTMKARKDFYRRNRDLCIISMVGVYLVAMVDAYVDASLAHFDISPDLSMRVGPALIPDARNTLPGVGLQWALNF